MKKTMETIKNAIGAIIAIGSLSIGVYTIFSTLLLTIFGLIYGYDKIKWRYMIADFFGLLTPDEIKILDNHENVED